MKIPFTFTGPLWAGFSFGFLLQLAIGPVCLYILNASNRHGFLVAEVGVLGVALVDGLYILAAIRGVGRLLRERGMQRLLAIVGITVLVGFGLSMIHHALTAAPAAVASEFAVATALTTLTGAILLTASSPLTILFWAGVFSTKMAESSLSRRQALIFGSGCVLSTIVFLSAVAVGGQLVHARLSPALIRGLNAGIGAVLIGFGIMKAFRIWHPSK
jgi:threonine/homoserine/homoserine lactone efflux protein